MLDYSRKQNEEPRITRIGRIKKEKMISESRINTDEHDSPCEESDGPGLNFWPLAFLWLF